MKTSQMGTPAKKAKNRDKARERAARHHVWLAKDPDITKKDLPKSWTDPSSRHEMVPIVPGVEKPRRHHQKEWETPSLQTTAKPPVAAQLWPPFTLVACLYIDWWWVCLTLHRGVTPLVGPVHPLPRMECWIA